MVEAFKLQFIGASFHNVGATNGRPYSRQKNSPTNPNLKIFSHPLAKSPRICYNNR